MTRIFGTLTLSAMALVLCADPTRAQYVSIDPFGSQSTIVRGVSGGNAVGYYLTAPNSINYYGYLYNGTTYTQLDPLRANFSDAYAVDGNKVVGYYGYYGNQNASYGYVYNIATQTYTTLDPFGARFAYVDAIEGNNVVGYYVLQAGSERYAFDYNILTHAYTALIPPGATISMATGVSGNNIVGQYIDGSGIYHGFLFNGTTYTTLTDGFVAVGISGNYVVGNKGPSGLPDGDVNNFLYNITSQTYTTLAPQGGVGASAVGISGVDVVGNEFGGPFSYMYNLSTQTYTQLQAFGDSTDVLGVSDGVAYGTYGAGGGTQILASFTNHPPRSQSRLA